VASFGHTGRILSIDLSARKIRGVPTSDYAERFVGDRGIANGLYRDHVPSKMVPPADSELRASPV
jgi:aldehyde:ferredoxin oxidoreductase